MVHDRTSRPAGVAIEGEHERRVLSVSTLLTITGTYRDGKVELSHRPEGLGENASVLVTFLPVNEGTEPVPASGRGGCARRFAGTA